MPQPQPPESDPLLAFFEEHESAAVPGQPPAAATDPTPGDVRVRVERAERHIDRALIDISTLKSDLATLVSAVDDIKKRQSRPPAKPATVVVSAAPPTGVRARTIAAVFALIALGAAIVGLAVQEGALGML